jgi:predicted RNA binding protein YcfA (HicA-like mRNA interferase family)
MRLAAANTRQNLERCGPCSRPVGRFAGDPERPLVGWPCQSWRNASLIRRLASHPTAPGWLSQGPPTVGSMPPLPRITGRELVQALGKLGWVVVAQKGSHAQLKHPSRGGRVTVPLHAVETIGPGLLRSILSQAGVTVEELRAVL